LWRCGERPGKEGLVLGIIVVGDETDLEAPGSTVDCNIEGRGEAGEDNFIVLPEEDPIDVDDFPWRCWFCICPRTISLRSGSKLDKFSDTSSCVSNVRSK